MEIVLLFTGSKEIKTPQHEHTLDVVKNIHKAELIHQYSTSLTPPRTGDYDFSVAK